MQILIIIANSNNTSITNLTLLLSHKLSADGYNVEIFEWRKYSFLQILKKLYLIIKDKNPPIIISCGAIADMFAAIFYLLGNSKKTKYVSWLHCHPWEDIKWERPFWIAVPYYLAWRLALIFKNTIVCVSNDVSDRLKNKYKNITILNPVITNVDNYNIGNYGNKKILDDWICECRINNSYILFSYGLLRKRKGYAELLELVSRNVRLSLLIFGEGEELENLIQLSYKLKLGNRLLIQPFVDNPSRFCSIVDCYISNTKSEGFGLANVEAALTGVDVILPALQVNLEILSTFKNVDFFNNKIKFSLDSIISLKLRNKDSSLYVQKHAINNPYTIELFYTNWLVKVIHPLKNEI